MLELEELEELEVAAVGQRSVEEELLLRLEEEVGESVAELLAVAVVMMGVGAVFNMTICFFFVQVGEIIIVVVGVLLYRECGNFLDRSVRLRFFVVVVGGFWVVNDIGLLGGLWIMDYALAHARKK